MYHGDPLQYADSSQQLSKRGWIRINVVGKIVKEEQLKLIVYLKHQRRPVHLRPGIAMLEGDINTKSASKVYSTVFRQQQPSYAPSLPNSFVHSALRFKSSPLTVGLEALIALTKSLTLRGGSSN